MIKVNELRIGNVIKVDSKGKCWEKGNIVTEFTLDSIYFERQCAAHVSMCSPIPLTQEVLEKLGFKATKLSYRWQLVLERHNSTFNAIINANGEAANIEHYDHVKYLHQFQNLIFAATGEELEINL